MDDILANITMNDDQHHDNSLISVLGQNALSGWPASIAPAGTLIVQISLRISWPYPTTSRSELVCSGDDPTTNSAASVPCFQASLVTSLNIDTVSKLSYAWSWSPWDLLKPPPPRARQTHIKHIDCNHCDFLTRPISSLPAWTTTPRPMMLFSPFRDSWV